MAATRLESSKAKIANRVIEVFEFFGSSRQPATVMDIARRYNRPQSSTSELLSSLVEMGLLYKDPVSRSFTPSPRLAALGMSAQPDVIRDGRLFNCMDRLAQTTRKTVALFGIVGTHVQIFRWIPSARPLSRDIACGSSERLSNSTAGLLLLSALTTEQARGTLWRLNAESAPQAKFDHAAMVERVAALRRKGHASGPSGFIASAHVSAVLLPQDVDQRPLALGVLYQSEAARDADALIDTMKHGINQVYHDNAPELRLAGSAPVEFLRAV